MPTRQSTCSSLVGSYGLVNEGKAMKEVGYSKPKKKPKWHMIHLPRITLENLLLQREQEYEPCTWNG